MTNANWFVYVWDIQTDNSKKAMFYKKLNGYKQRRYFEVAGLNEAVAERLRGKDLVHIDPDDFPEGIDGVTKDGRLFKVYEYEGILEEIPPDHRIRLNDSTYAFFEPAVGKVEELLDKYEEIFVSLYKIEIGEWSEIQPIIAEGEADSPPRG